MSFVSSSKNPFIKRLPLIMAFLVPCIVLVCIYIGRGIYPFGEQMYLRSDMYHQYATFLKQFQTILKEGGSLTYSWNIGLGSDFMSLYAYYLASPVNWLVAFLPSTHIPEIMSGFIIIKSGLMSLTFSYYLQKRFGRNTFQSAAFGIFYALSSYMAAYSWNLMWLDCLVLLPLIVLGLERLVKERKILLYTVTLAIAILSNYYIAIMICIFLVMYFIYLLLCETGREGVRTKLMTLGRFTFCSLFAGLIACAVFVPAFSVLSDTASGSFNFPSTIKFYFSFIEEVAHAEMNVDVTMLKGYVPNIYCTVALFMLVPLFWFAKKIPLRRKTGLSVLMLIFLVSFACNITSYIWHGFHYPNSLASRQSFIYIFLILTVGYEALGRLYEFTYVRLCLCFAAGLAAVFVFALLTLSDTYTIDIPIISAVFLLAYFGWMCAAKFCSEKISAQRALSAEYFTDKKSSFYKILAASLAALIAALACAEAAINTEHTGYSTTNRTSYISDNEDIDNLLSYVDDGSFYRVEKTDRRTKNDGAWSDYMSASEFSSTTPAALSKLYDALGLQSSTNSISYYGRTPLVTALFGVKYEISEDYTDSDALKELVYESGDLKLYENKYALSLGFMVGEGADSADISSENPFVVQNNIVQALCGVEDMFFPRSYYKGTEIIFTLSADGRQYIHINEKIESATVTVYRGGSLYSTNVFSDLENPQIIDIGELLEGDEIHIVSSDDEVTEISVYTGSLNYDKLDEVMSLLSENQYETETFEDTYIKGTITAKEDGMMLTSITYYPGWSVYVDGKKAETKSFKDALVMVDITEGTHVVEFRYEPPGFTAAVAVSILAVIVFAVWYILRKKMLMSASLSPAGISPAKALPEESLLLPDPFNPETSEKFKKRRGKKKMEIRTRYAPSPTGKMHVGNLRTALYEYLIARHEGGKFIIRIEDTDRERFVEGALDIIYDTLKAANLDYDEGPDKPGEYGPYVQSERVAAGLYTEYAKKLVEKGKAYYCFCTKERLDSLKSEVGGKEISVYDKHCLSLSKEEVEERLKNGAAHVIRQNVPREGTTSFTDVIYGEITVENSELDDMILIKSDGYPTYNFANVIDDHLMGITHVVRGNEYLSSTPKYILLYEAFGWEPPVFVHLPLITDEEHHKLSKRSGHSSFEDLLDQGFVAEAIVNFVALLGWSPEDNNEIFDMETLIKEFDYHRINKSPAVFDMQKLRWMNGEYIKAMDFEKYKGFAMPYLKKAIGTNRLLEMPENKILELLKTRIETFADIPEKIDFLEELPEYDASMYVHKKMKTTLESSLEVLSETFEIIRKQDDYSIDSLRTVISAYVEEKGLKNGAVLWPLRTAVSGKQSTPGGAFEIMEILGKEESLARIEKGIEKLKGAVEIS